MVNLLLETFAMYNFSHFLQVISKGLEFTDNERCLVTDFHKNALDNI